MKSIRMKLAGYVERIGKEEVHTVFWWGNIKERGHLKREGIEGIMILKQFGTAWTGVIWLRTVERGGLSSAWS
jgi:hypothetical protein